MHAPSWSLRIHSPSPGKATAFVRKQRLTLGEPLSFDPEYDGVTAIEHVLAGIGGDLVGCIRRAARRQRVEVDDIEVVVDARLENALTYLGVIGEEGTPRLTRVGIVVYLSSFAEPDRIDGVWEEALVASPMACTLGAAGLLEAELRVVL